MGLIYFLGGPMDGQAYETKDLLGKEALTLPITEYKWTSEKRTSQVTSAVAQVWKHVSVVDGSDSPAPTPAAAPAATPPPPPVDTAVENDGKSTAVTIAPQKEVLLELESQLGPNPLPAEEEAAPPAQATTDEGELPSGESLLDRRKALKASRAEVSQRSGLAQSKIDTIENNKPGKRVKPEEVRALADALARLEAERGGAGAHS